MKVLVAAVQMDSGTDVQANLAAALRLVRKAAEQGAQLICLPENMAYAGPHPEQAAEPVPGPISERFARTAAEYGVWLHCGSLYEAGEDRKIYNTSLLFSPKGELRAVYRKLHPFDVVLPDGTVSRESADICSGREITVCDTGEVGCLGLSICYDIRFPELFRLMALEGAEVLLTPANFTRPTGQAHWETLLRARAIENGCYVVAPAQCGQKNLYEANGNAMIIDPWGTILARAGEQEEVILAQTDLEYLRTIRQKLGTLDNRRTDMYQLHRADQRI